MKPNIYLITSAINLLLRKNNFNNIASLLFLPGIGLNGMGGAPYFGLGNNHPSWFVAALIVGESLFFFIYSLCWERKKFLELIVFLLILFSMRAVFFSRDIAEINLGLWRSILGMSLGYLVATSVSKYQVYLDNISERTKLLITFVEFILLVCLFKGIFFHTGPPTNVLLLILNFSLLLVFLCLSKGYVSRLLSIKIFSLLGKFAFSIYITHALILEVCLKVFYPNCQGLPLLAILVTPVIISVIFGILAFYLVEKPIYNQLRSYL